MFQSRRLRHFPHSSCLVTSTNCSADGLLQRIGGIVVVDCGCYAGDDVIAGAVPVSVSKLSFLSVCVQFSCRQCCVVAASSHSQHEQLFISWVGDWDRIAGRLKRKRSVISDINNTTSSHHGRLDTARWSVCTAVVKWLLQWCDVMMTMFVFKWPGVGLGTEQTHCRGWEERRVLLHVVTHTVTIDWWHSPVWTLQIVPERGLGLHCRAAAVLQSGASSCSCITIDR